VTTTERLVALLLAATTSCSPHPPSPPVLSWVYYDGDKFCESAIPLSHWQRKRASAWEWIPCDQAESRDGVCIRWATHDAVDVESSGLFSQGVRTRGLTAGELADASVSRVEFPTMRMAMQDGRSWVEAHYWRSGERRTILFYSDFVTRIVGFWESGAVKYTGCQSGSTNVGDWNLFDEEGRTVLAGTVGGAWTTSLENLQAKWVQGAPLSSSDLSAGLKSLE